MKNKTRLFLGAATLVIAACNIYRPLNSANESNDYIEEAQRCLHNSDYACAVEQYSKLPAGDEREQYLCLTYLSEGSMGLQDLVNVVNQGTATMMGTLAQSISPWTAEKKIALDNAKTHCDLGGRGNKGILLRVLGRYAHCAVLMAKADLFVGNSSSDTTCTTVGNGNGTIQKADISDNSDGSVSSVGMCATDVITCGEDISGIADGDLSGAGLGDLETAYDAIPADLRNSSATTQQRRAALYSATP